MKADGRMSHLYGDRYLWYEKTQEARRWAIKMKAERDEWHNLYDAGVESELGKIEKIEHLEADNARLQEKLSDMNDNVSIVSQLVAETERENARLREENSKLADARLADVQAMTSMNNKIARLRALIKNKEWLLIEDQYICPHCGAPWFITNVNNRHYDTCPAFNPDGTVK